MRIMFRFKVDNMLESCPGRKAQEQRSEPCVQVTSPHIICQSIHGQRTYLYNYTSPHAYITFIILLYFLQNHRYAGVARRLRGTGTKVLRVATGAHPSPHISKAFVVFLLHLNSIC